jgi:hypothetical protein
MMLSDGAVSDTGVWGASCCVSIEKSFPSRPAAVKVRGLSRAIEGTLIYLILLADVGV